MWNPVPRPERRFGSARIAVVGALAVALTTATLIVASHAAAAPVAADANQNSLVYPPRSHPGGNSYAEWGRIWWEWALSYPASGNPLFDDGVVTYGDADEQPSGSVWYLAGNFGGSSERTLTVPEDTALVVPLYNFFTWAPEDCWWLGASEEPATCTVEEMTLALDAAVAAAPDMTASLDGFEFTNLTDYRARLSETFTYDIVAGSLPADFEYSLGERYPTRSDGYYLILKPLDPGEHTLTFAVDGFLDVTYHLTVE